MNGSEGSGSSSELVWTSELDVYIHKNCNFFYLITRLIDSDGRMSTRDSKVYLSSNRNMTLAISTFKSWRAANASIDQEESENGILDTMPKNSVFEV